MTDLVNLIHQEIERALAGRYGQRDVSVTSYDPDQHAIKGAIQPGGQETGWIPLGAQMVGNGWGVVMGASVGEIYKVQFQENDLESGKVVGRVYTDEDKPPRVESGEMAFVNSKQGILKSDKDGHWSITQTSGTNIQAHHDGTVGVQPGGGKKVYLGHVSGANCYPVATSAGYSTNVLAKV